MATHPLLSRFPIISNQMEQDELSVILHELQKVLDTSIAGDVVEFGCYTGTTALFVRRLLLAHNSDKALHVYDSFEGLPQKSKEDESPAGAQFRAGELLARKTDLIKHFKRAGLPLPHIHKGWFSEISKEQVPDKIAFAFLDGDFYKSIKDSLKLIWPHLSPGAIVVIDDYQSEALPGARRAVDEWLMNHDGQLRAQHSLAVIYI